MMAAAGMDQQASFVATCLASALACFLMVLYANWPVGLAPGMHGANRTGRPFTGDHAGILLYEMVSGVSPFRVPGASASTLRTAVLYESARFHHLRVRVEFEDVAFDDLVLWLGDLSSQYGLVIQQGSFSRSATGIGRVNSTLTLERTL